MSRVYDHSTDHSLIRRPNFNYFTSPHMIPTQFSVMPPPPPLYGAPIFLSSRPPTFPSHMFQMQLQQSRMNFQPPPRPLNQIEISNPMNLSNPNAGNTFLNTVRNRLEPQEILSTEEEEVKRRWKIQMDNVANRGDINRVHQMASVSAEVIRFVCDYTAEIRAEFETNYEEEIHELIEQEAVELAEKTSSSLNPYAVPFIPLQKSANFSADSTFNKPEKLINDFHESAENLVHDPKDTMDFHQFFRSLQINSTEKSSTDEQNEIIPNILPFGRQSPGFRSGLKQKLRKSTGPTIEDFNEVLQATSSKAEISPLTPPTSTTSPSASLSNSVFETGYEIGNQVDDEVGNEVEHEVVKKHVPWSTGLSEEDIQTVEDYFRNAKFQI